MIAAEFKFKFHGCQICASHELSCLAKTDLRHFVDILAGANIEKNSHVSLLKQDAV